MDLQVTEQFVMVAKDDSILKEDLGSCHIIMTISVENYIHLQGHVCLWKRLIKGNYFHEKAQQINLSFILNLS